MGLVLCANLNSMQGAHLQWCMTASSLHPDACPAFSACVNTIQLRSLLCWLAHPAGLPLTMCISVLLLQAVQGTREKAMVADTKMDVYALCQAMLKS